MSKKPIGFLVGGLLILVIAQSNVWAQSNSRETLLNSTGVELLGNSLVYSFYYQRMVSPSFGLEVGLSGFGGGGSGGSSTIIFVPAGGKLYLIPKSGSIYLTGGGVLVTASVDSGPFDDSASTIYGYAGLGFEHRATGGFTFRFTAYSLFAGGGFFIWPGLTLGHSF